MHGTNRRSVVACTTSKWWLGAMVWRVVAGLSCAAMCGARTHPIEEIEVAFVRGRAALTLDLPSVNHTTTGCQLLGDDGGVRCDELEAVAVHPHPHAEDASVDQPLARLVVDVRPLYA